MCLLAIVIKRHIFIFMNNTAKTYTIAFYNIENLFDTENDPLTHDDDFLPTAKKQWTTKRYDKKIRKISTFNKYPKTELEFFFQIDLKLVNDKKKTTTEYPKQFY